MTFSRGIVLTLFSLISFFNNTCYSQTEITVSTSSDIEINVSRFTSTHKTPGKYLILWVAPEYGFRVSHRSMAQLLTEQNIEVWQSNIVESLFMPQGSASLKKLDGNNIADLIEYAYKITGKKIIVAGDSYASVSALMGAHQWQSRKHKPAYLVGAILFSPYSYAYIPSLGVDPEYMPIINATNIPIMIYQTKGSVSINQFKNLLEKLQQHNNPLYTKIIPDIISLFYDENPTAEIKNHIKALPPNIKKMIAFLDKKTVPVNPVPLNNREKIKSGIDIDLKKFKGKTEPLVINLLDAHGVQFNKNNYKNRVTVVNFWATWCPPCVEEIPSLNRLKQKMKGKAFDLISINYAEDKQVILDFLKEVDVDYPVLMDQDGRFAKKWNVITYPSTFLIDKNGKIIYGVNSAIVWDAPEVIDIINALY
ncbi:MAG: TlpA family protein disulfide reductase [Gammaproteobacteria bacterium]|nr:TlpA family protein disulfide reductase [Gammaproteobacteria bacterium]